MKNNLFLKLSLLLFCFSIMNNSAFGQSKYLLIKKKNTEKIKIFNDGFRLKIRNLEGKKVKGNFSIIDSNTIKIKNQFINLSEIKRIRSKRSYGKYLGAFIIFGGSQTILISPATAIHKTDGGKSVRNLALLGAGIVGTGILIQHLLPPAYHHEKWEYKIIINE